ncbi:C-GCAxxG-C-C family protein [Bacillota bacterium]
MNIPRIMELKMSGLCCSQIIMKMGLEGLGRGNEDLIKAMAGLCDGMHKGSTCGTISAAVCLLYMIDKEKAGRLADEIWDWFEDSFGSTECNTLIEGNPLKKTQICGDLVENTYLKLLEIFEDNNIAFDAHESY